MKRYTISTDNYLEAVRAVAKALADDPAATSVIEIETTYDAGDRRVIVKATARDRRSKRRASKGAAQ